jgi:hypothetical protein
MAILTQIKVWLIAALAALSALFGIYLYGRQQGSHREAQKAAEKDRQNARRIEDVADSARTDTGDPVERLHKHGKLRD